MDFLIKKWSEKPIDRRRGLGQIKQENAKNFTEKKKEDNLSEIEEKSLKHIKNYDQGLVRLAEEINKISCATKINKNTVIGRGDFHSSIMIIGEAPGEEENKQQIPVVGSSGKLLKKMLNGIAISDEKVYITNIFFWQPDNSRTPNEQELALTLPYVIEHINLQKPKLIITLGAVATKTLLSTKESITGLRGTFKNISFDNNNYYDLFITFHPAYILRNHRHEDYAKDFLQIRNFLQDRNLYNKVNEEEV